MTFVQSLASKCPSIPHNAPYASRIGNSRSVLNRSRDAIPYPFSGEAVALKGEEYETCEVNREFKSFRVGFTFGSIRAGFRHTSRWKALHRSLRRHLQVEERRLQPDTAQARTQDL